MVTWPEGNAHLVKHLRAPLKGRTRTNHAVVSVKNDAEGVVIHALHADGAGEPLPTSSKAILAHAILDRLDALLAAKK